jgi:transcriptional regulator GlxA family with amidase domain
MKRKIALLIFDDVEVLDFAGPFEVFSVADERHDYKLFDITVVAKVKEPVTARNGLSVNPHRTINEVSQVDMLLVPGGLGTRPLIRDQEVVDWVRRVGENATHVMSVCSGALVLAKAGLLHGLKATTHQGALKLLAELAPDTEVIPDMRFTDNGKVEQLHGPAVADATATYMEYRRS